MRHFLFSVFVLSVASRIDNPRTLSAKFTGAQTTFMQPVWENSFAMISDGRRAKSAVWRSIFWVNAQDWKITDLTITSTDESQERKTVIAKFINIGAPQEIRFDFRRNAGRWLLDDVHSALAPRWTLSEILKCVP